MMAFAKGDVGLAHAPTPAGKRRLLQLVAALPLPLLVALWALWRDVVVLDATGLERVGDGRAVAAWALLSLASAALVGCLFAPVRPLRVTGYTFHTMLLALASAPRPCWRWRTASAAPPATSRHRAGRSRASRPRRSRAPSRSSRPRRCS